MRATRAARAIALPRASVSRAAQNSGSSAIEVRWPAMEKERFLRRPGLAIPALTENALSLRMDHVFGADDGVEFRSGDKAGLQRFLAQSRAILMRGLGDLRG